MFAIHVNFIVHVKRDLVLFAHILLDFTGLQRFLIRKKFEDSGFRQNPFVSSINLAIKLVAWKGGDFQASIGVFFIQLLQTLVIVVGEAAF